MDMASKDRRTYVRGDLSFKVKYREVSREEYERVKEAGDQFLSLSNRAGFDVSDTDRKDNETTPNASMIDFLVHLDEKVDQILALLSNKEVPDGVFRQGMGLNISGSGMNVLVDEPLDHGKIIHANFVLTKFPIVFIKVFGEVDRVTPMKEDGKTLYKLGIEFLDLNPNDREKIIACVFQKQRETLRKRNNAGLDGNGS